MCMRQGFSLVYTLLITSVILIIVSLAFKGGIFETLTARTGAESLKAFYAADTGIECVRFYQTYYRAFNTTVSQASYDCDGPTGGSPSFLAGGNPSDQPAASSECVEVPGGYDFQITDFSNDTCVEIHIDVIPRSITIGAGTTKVCDFRVVSTGRNYPCGVTGSNLIERVRWENM